MKPARPTYAFDVEGHTVVVKEPKSCKETIYCPDCPDCDTCPESSK